MARPNAFGSWIAACLHVTLRKRLEAHAPGLTPRAVLESLSGILMLDVHLPLADGRELVLPRYTQPEPERLVAYIANNPVKARFCKRPEDWKWSSAHERR